MTADGRNTFENLDARETATFELGERVAEATPAGPLTAIAWLAFVILLCCSPAIVMAVWGAL